MLKRQIREAYSNRTLVLFAVIVLVVIFGGVAEYNHRHIDLMDVLGLTELRGRPVLEILTDMDPAQRAGLLAGSAPPAWHRQASARSHYRGNSGLSGRTAAAQSPVRGPDRPASPSLTSQNHHPQHRQGCRPAKDYHPGREDRCCLGRRKSVLQWPLCDRHAGQV